MTGTNPNLKAQALPAVKKALILAGDGINAECEGAWACTQAGFTSDIRHINDLIADAVTLDQLSATYSLLYLPGGFSFGDELGSGRVLALKLKHRLKWDLHQFAARGGLVMGVCNGFQALIKLGVFGTDVTITHNASGRFMNRWTEVTIASDLSSPWISRGGKAPLKKGASLSLPIRHGEGRLVFRGASASPDHRQIALHYAQDVNGSFERIAGLSDPSGRILGLMPHPEAFVRQSQRPDWTGEESTRDGEEAGAGLEFFTNAFREAART